MEGWDVTAWTDHQAKESRCGLENIERSQELPEPLVILAISAASPVASLDDNGLKSSL